MKAFFLSILLLSPLVALAIDSEQKTDFLLWEQYRDAHQRGFGSFRSGAENFFIASSEWKFTSDAWRLEAKPQLRSFTGTARKEPASVTAQSVSYPGRFANLAIKLNSDQHNESILDFERLNLNFEQDGFTANLGRKPIGIGVLKVLPIWNKFSRPLPTQADPGLIYGQDSANVRYQKDIWSGQAFTIQNDSSERAVYLTEGIVYSPLVEAHVLASHWWDQNVLGLAAAKDLGGFTARAEGLWIGVSPRDTDRQFQGGLGTEFAASASWSFIGEFMYLSEGKTHQTDYPLTITSRFQPLRARDYGLLQAQYEISSFWNLSFAVFANFVDWSRYGLLKLNHSLSDHADVGLEAKIPSGQNGAEFSNRTFSFANGSYIGAPTDIAVNLHLFL